MVLEGNERTNDGQSLGRGRWVRMLARRRKRAEDERSQDEWESRHPKRHGDKALELRIQRVGDVRSRHGYGEERKIRRGGGGAPPGPVPAIGCEAHRSPCSKDIWSHRVVLAVSGCASSANVYRAPLGGLALFRGPVRGPAELEALPDPGAA